MDYKIVFTKRRTVALTVNRTGELIVRAPKRAPISFIEQLINKKSDWIKKALSLQLNRKNIKQFAEGETFLYLGKQYRLHIVDEYKSKLNFNGSFELSKYKISLAKNLFTDWYKIQAKSIILNRAKFYAGFMGLQFNKLTIKNMASRWGSCSNAGNINFSYRLIMAPLEVLDYVVVHELAHLKHHNHSAAFWKFVGNFCPDYKILSKYLHQNGHLFVV